MEADGPLEEHFVDFTFQPLTNADGQVTGIFVHGVDLSQRKRAEQEREAALTALRETQDRQELAFEAVHLGVWELDLQTGHQVWSGEQERLFGLERGTFAGDISSFLALIHSDDRKRVAESTRRRFADRATTEYEDEFRVVQPNTGRVCWLYGRARIERDPTTGEALRVTGVNLDITERKEDEEELRQSAEAVKQSETAVRVSEATLRLSEERYRALVDASSQIVWTNSADGRMTGEQPGWSAFTGMGSDEYQGFGWAEAVHPDDRQPTVGEWNRCVAERATFCWEHRVRRSDGVYRNFSVRAVPILSGDGTIREWVGIHTDVTEQRANEASLREAADRFAVLNRINTALRSSFDPGEIEQAAVTILEEVLRADRCFTVSYHIAENYATASSEYRSHPNDLPPMAGRRHTLSDYDAVMRSFVLSPQAQVMEDVRQAKGLDAVTITRMEGHGMRSFVRVPLYEAGVLVGSLAVAMADAPHAWLQGEIELIQTVAAQVRPVVEAARAHKELEEAEAKQRRIADALQESMLLVSPPTNTFPGLDVDTHYEAAWDEAQIGGDYSDAFKVDAHRVALLVGDCTGKGLAAAQFVSQCLFVCRAFLREKPDDPADALLRLNRMLLNSQQLDGKPEGTLTTLAVVVIDCRTGEAQFVAGGAEPPLIVRSQSGESEEIEVRGFLVGMDIEAEYDTARATLHPGDLVFLTTDGTTEARNRKTRSFFGYDGVTEAVRNVAQGSRAAVKGTACEIITHATAFAAGALSDDACVLVARFKGYDGADSDSSARKW